ncbi:hypothetical protein PPTG_17999 [Phytophthora nicotianae INRA-310]|uniref:ISXO2-like transposase domain-containing protein n=1 Tax=Phytophthora nicotianae (strain INRA-310) TaxID=761204 RepID=W2PJX4_PHYN3|nr:hypothetical protein PPTG_17999 [Phytophthora nicotianae INRA-310]ETN00554.1 hypothetical protein PPTG_17999 [Phytophthora nicotianae INRA-310]
MPAAHVFKGIRKDETLAVLPQEIPSSTATVGMVHAGVARQRCGDSGRAGDYSGGLIGGVGHIVEIDETSLKKKSKHNRGRHFPEYWLVGGVDRSSGQWFGRIVDTDRIQKKLFPVVRKFINPGATLYSDMYATYVTERKPKRGVLIRTLTNHPSLQDLNYTHKYVNHTEHYVEPETGTHTNTIEGLWEIDIKRLIKVMQGMTKSALDGYLVEYMWHSWYFPREATTAQVMCGLVQLINRQGA